MKPISELINDLFAAYRRIDGKEYTNKEVCTALNGAIDPSYLSKLRTGKITNPGRNTLLCLCIFFKESPTYFFPELTILEESSTFQAERNVEYFYNALHLLGLGPEIEEKLKELTMTLYNLEKKEPP